MPYKRIDLPWAGPIFVNMKGLPPLGLLTATLLALATACNGPKPGQEQARPPADSAVGMPTASVADTLVYRLDSATAADPTCQAKRDPELCTSARILFPDLGGSGAPAALVANMLRQVALATGQVADTSRQIPAPEALVKAFMDSFQAERKLFRQLDPEARANPWALDVRCRLRESAGLVFVETESYTYTGGAHGMGLTRWQAHDRASGAPVALANWLADAAALRRVQALAEAVFRRQEGLRKGKGYQDYFFDNGRFALPDNWRIRADTLEFIYNPYEIKPYAAGKTRLALPVSAIDSLIVPAYRPQAAI